MRVQRLPGFDLDLPLGYNFAPTDKELVDEYLVTKTMGKPQPAAFVHDATAEELRSSLINFRWLDDYGVNGPYGQKAWYFFVAFCAFPMNHTQSDIDDSEDRSWRAIEDDKPIYKSNGTIYAYKRKMGYFIRSDTRIEQTNWKLDMYKLTDDFLMENRVEGDQYLLGRIRYRPRQGNEITDQGIQIRGINVSWEMSETNHEEKFYFTHRLAGLDLDLPIGYYFVPTDVELVKDYLVPKTLGEPQPAGFVHDADAQDIYDPSLNHQLLDIQGVKGARGQKALYFFIRVNWHPGSEQVDDENGTWRTLADDKLIRNTDGRLYAYKRKMEYFKPQTQITGWEMDEYRLAEDFLMDNHIEGEQYALARIRYRPQTSGATFLTRTAVLHGNNHKPRDATEIEDQENLIREINTSSKGSETNMEEKLKIKKETNMEEKLKIKNLKYFR